jgi:hypothetical protein
MNKEELSGYENPNAIMICPEEGYAYDLNGNPYHKLRSGCGWIGSRKECEEEIFGPTLLSAHQWIEYLCPNCDDQKPYYSMKVENKDKLIAMLENPSLIPAMNPMFAQWDDRVLLSTSLSDFNWGRKFFLDTFKGGDRDYYKNWKNK